MSKESEESDDDDEDDEEHSEIFDGGFEDEMAIEEQFEEKVEKVRQELRVKLHNREQVPRGALAGVWNIHSPNYLDLREVNNRPKQWGTGVQRDYRNWGRGTLKIGDEYGNASTFGTDTVGVLHLDGLEPDWRIYLNNPQLATLEVRQCTTVKQPLRGRAPMDAEVQVGVLFLGDGYLRIKIPSTSPAGPEEWNRYVILYAVREQDDGIEILGFLASPLSIPN
jgi:hypothetical protein